MFFKNVSYSAKTFYGVTFGPGEVKEVDGQINSRWLIPVDGPATVPEQVQKKPSSDKSKKESEKPDEPKQTAKESEVSESKQEEKVDQKSSK